MASRAWLIVPLALAASACTTATARSPATRAARSCVAASATLASPPGQKWLEGQGWRFRTREDAAAAYARLVREASPWPDWMNPVRTVLPVGTRFQMAIGGAQSPERPGAFGTFDRIARVRDVRTGLAVKQEWKPDVDRVVTYEVVEPLPADVGPVGPQVDGLACRLLPGRWSQFQMLVPPEARMKHLRVLGVRSIR